MLVGLRQRSIFAPAGAAPVMRERMVRRTSSIEATWPDGFDGIMRYEARARDLVTGDRPTIWSVTTKGGFVAGIGPDRVIHSIQAMDNGPDLRPLVGETCGRGYRKALNKLLFDERAGAAPLYSLLDDIAGFSVVASGWGAMQNAALAPQSASFEAALEARKIARVGVCIGLKEGASGLNRRIIDHGDDGRSVVSDVRNAADPNGWHIFPDSMGPSVRRVRRLDIWHDTDIHINAMFQDSWQDEHGGHHGIHEYALHATADLASGALTQLRAVPHILPYDECPAAVGNIHRLQSAALHELREAVLLHLPKEQGCTHLNDALRALADVPQLVTHLLS